VFVEKEIGRSTRRFPRFATQLSPLPISTQSEHGREPSHLLFVRLHSWQDLGALDFEASLRAFFRSIEDGKTFAQLSASFSCALSIMPETHILLFEVVRGVSDTLGATSNRDIPTVLFLKPQQRFFSANLPFFVKNNVVKKEKLRMAPNVLTCGNNTSCRRLVWLKC
jgi:hypothetical protein